MIRFVCMYTFLKHLHFTCVVASFCGFALRFALKTGGSPLIEHRVARTAPHVVDTVLLGAAIGMLWLGGLNPFEQPWLLAKIAGLLAYIGFGILALRRARTPAGRILAFAAAAASFAFVLGAALTKSAWGVFALVG